MKTLPSIVLAVSMLTGCFNTSTFTNTHYTQSNEYNFLSQSKEVSKAPICPMYVPLPIVLPPEIPVEKIRKNKVISDKEMLYILTKHIKDLREHIANRKKQEAMHYESYLLECTSSLK